MRRWLIILCCFLTSLLGLVGCSHSEPNVEQKVMYTAVDARGVKIHLTSEPKRVLPFGVSIEEITMEMLPPSQIVGISNLASNVPEKAKLIKGRVSSNIESVIKLQPDLVIGQDWANPELVSQIEALGIPVYLSKTPRKIEEIGTEITKIGNLLGKPQVAARIIENMNVRMGKIRRKVTAGKKRGITEPKVVCYGTNGMIGGKGSMFAEICELAGMKDATATLDIRPGVILAKESVVNLAPDLIVIPGNEYDTENYTSLTGEDLLKDPALQTVPAIRNKKICRVSAKEIYSLNHYLLGVAEALADYWYGG